MHRRSGEPDPFLDGAVLADVAAEHELAEGVPSVHDAQGLADPLREIRDELSDAGDGGPGVDERQAVVVLAATVREHS